MKFFVFSGLCFVTYVVILIIVVTNDFPQETKNALGLVMVVTGLIGSCFLMLLVFMITGRVEGHDKDGNPWFMGPYGW